MTPPCRQVPVLLVIAAFSRHAGALTWGRQQLEEAFGPVTLAGPVYAFHQTDYYEKTMGPGLQKQLLVFRDLVAEGDLADLKLRTCALEQELAQAGTYPEPRPLNLDPGVLSLVKFLLASTKDRAHRVYLRDGIFAEVTLYFRAGVFEPWPWTYADYCQPSVLRFLEQARSYYRDQLAEKPSAAMHGVP
jgi:hypothetical protein